MICFYYIIFCVDIVYIVVDECGVFSKVIGCFMCIIFILDGKLILELLKLFMVNFGIEYYF